MRSVYKMLVEDHERTRTHWGPRCGWKDTIKMNRNEREYLSVGHADVTENLASDGMLKTR